MSQDAWVPEILPRGWAAPKISCLCNVVRGGSPRPMGDPRYFGGAIPFIKIADVTSSDGLVVYDSETKVTPDGALRSRLLKAGSLILTNSATVCVPVFLGVDACIHDGFVAFEEMPSFVDRKYLYYFFKFVRPYVLAANKQGVTQVNLNTTIVGDMRLLLPPAHEQPRIIAKIEELFSELDKGVESLTTTREQLKAYRQSVLKAAFEGKLTEEWRLKITGKIESPEALLVRIKREREAHYRASIEEWEKAIINWRADGEMGSKPTKPRSLKDYPNEFHDLRIALPELPSGWAWSHLGRCSSGPEYGTAAKSSESGTVPVVRMGNLQNGRIDWSDLVYTSDQQEIGKYSLRPGDVLYNRTNSPELVGKTSIYKSERPALFAGYLVRVNQIESIALGQYVTYFLNSPIAREHGNTVKTDGVNQSNINGTKLQEYPFPFCSLAEQAEIVRILDAKLEAAEVMETEIEAGLARTAALRQSILKRAFSGQLVAQDPSDEAASVLLDQIRAKRLSDISSKTIRKTANGS